MQPPSVYDLWSVGMYPGLYKLVSIVYPLILYLQVPKDYDFDNPEGRVIDREPDDTYDFIVSEFTSAKNLQLSQRLKKKSFKRISRKICYKSNRTQRSGDIIRDLDSGHKEEENLQRLRGRYWSILIFCFSTPR